MHSDKRGPTHRHTESISLLLKTESNLGYLVGYLLFWFWWNETWETTANSSNLNFFRRLSKIQSWHLWLLQLIFNSTDSPTDLLMNHITRRNKFTRLWTCLISIINYNINRYLSFYSSWGHLPTRTYHSSQNLISTNHWNLRQLRWLNDPGITLNSYMKFLFIYYLSDYASFL